MPGMKRSLTIEPVAPGECSHILPEFARSDGVDHLFGIGRSTLYGLYRRGKIRAVLLRCAGSKSGLRLWHVDSIREYIKAEMARQNPEAAATSASTPPASQAPEVA
jgi:hypothetical protein